MGPPGAAVAAVVGAAVVGAAVACATWVAAAVGCGAVVFSQRFDLVRAELEERSLRVEHLDVPEASGPVSLHRARVRRLGCRKSALTQGNSLDVCGRERFVS